MRGEAIVLGDNINTDLIISGRYKFSITDIKELARHILEDIDKDFFRKIVPGETILVAGNNFGMGSSREQAPLVIKEAGISAVVAKNFARIFYRNAFNIGLLLIEADTSNIAENDILEINIDKGIINNTTQGIRISIKALPAFMQELLRAGGVINYLKEHGEFKL